MPQPVRILLDLTHLKQLCLRLGIARIDAGPQAIAPTFRPGSVDRLPLRSIMADSGCELRWSGERLILAEERQRHIIALLERFERNRAPAGPVGCVNQINPTELTH